MKRIHIHVGVTQLDEAIRFYSGLFGAEPVKIKHDYAKWMLDAPALNFAISTGSGKTGVNHLGIQVDEEQELAELRERVGEVHLNTFDEGETVCCYAKSDKSWLLDPVGVPWEAYRTMEDAQFYDAQRPETPAPQSACGTGNKMIAGCCAR